MLPDLLDAAMEDEADRRPSDMHSQLRPRLLAPTRLDRLECAAASVGRLVENIRALKAGVTPSDLSMIHRLNIAK